MAYILFFLELNEWNKIEWLYLIYAERSDASAVGGRYPPKRASPPHAETASQPSPPPAVPA